MTLRRGTVRARRPEKRRRVAPEEGADWWEWATTVLLHRSGGRCERDGCDLYQQGIERHHRMRRREGGDRLAALAVLSPACHQWITEHPAEARRTGHIVATWADLLAVPMLIQGKWYLLDDLGNKTEIALFPDAHAHDVARSLNGAKPTTTE